MPTVNVHKVKLSTGKEVVLGEFKIRTQELAIKAVGNKAGGNEALRDLYVSQELVKLLLLEVDGQPVDKHRIEDLDSLFNLREFKQVQQSIQRISGMDEEADPNVEIVTR